MIKVEFEEKVVDVFTMADYGKFIDKLIPIIQWTHKYVWDKDLEERKRVNYLNIPVSFDIETSSFYNENKTGKFYSNSDIWEKISTIEKREYQTYLKKYKSTKKAKVKANLKAQKELENYSKNGCMYIWQMAFGTDDLVMVGRTWQEWADFMAMLKNALQLDEYRKMIIYVHNLSYEFGWIKNYFVWGDCLLSKTVTYYANTKGLYFADDSYSLGYGVEEFEGFTFKDSLILAGVKEEKLPDIMYKYGKKCKKLVGQLDYNKVRHSETPLTNEEMQYCINDVILLNWYIREKQEEEYAGGKICNIAMTKTGEIRNACRNALFYSTAKHYKNDSKRLKYKDFLDYMKITYNEYQQVKRAFQGGFTHANYNNARKVLKDCVMSMDLASSYPSVMVSKKFPMGPYEKVVVTDKKQFNYYINNYSCLFDVHLHDLRPRYDEETGVDYDLIENIISINKAEEYGRSYPNCKPQFPISDEEFYNNNGRIRYADEIYLTINEIDWEAICQFYDFDRDRVEVVNFRIARKDYLPKDLILFILQLFNNKTKFKPFDGTETPEGLQYKIAKVFINSVFGMIATDNLKESFVLDEDNILKPKHEGIDADTLNEIRAQEWEEYLDKDSTFLCYQWSHVLTSWARLNLFKAIEASGTNHVYSDTDSEKFIKNEKTLKFREEFNANVDKEMNACFEYHGIPKDSHKASYIKDGKKIEKCLGYFELENGGKPYKQFVTCGAKRYLTECEDGLHLTVAGLNKKSISYLQDKYKDKLFKVFAKGEIEVDRQHTGKLAATYDVYSNKGIVIDYLGKQSTYAEVCSVHLEPVEFKMSLTDTYEKLTNEGRIWETI